MSTERVAPLARWFGEVDVTTGAGRIVRHPRHMAVPPPEVTVRSRAPTGAVAVAFTLMDSLVLLTKAVETTVTPVPDTVVVAPDWKLVPFTARVRVPFWPSVAVRVRDDDTLGAGGCVHRGDVQRDLGSTVESHTVDGHPACDGGIDVAERDGVPTQVRARVVEARSGRLGPGDRDVH